MLAETQVQNIAEHARYNRTYGLDEDNWWKDTLALCTDWQAMRKLLIEASGMLKLLDRNTKYESVTEWLTKWNAIAALAQETP